MHGRRSRDRVHDQLSYLEDKDRLAVTAVHPEAQEAEAAAAAHQEEEAAHQPALAESLARWAMCHRASYSTIE